MPHSSPYCDAGPLAGLIVVRGEWLTYIWIYALGIGRWLERNRKFDMNCRPDYRFVDSIINKLNTKWKQVSM
jgi:hypothetical protein